MPRNVSGKQVTPIKLHQCMSIHMSNVYPVNSDECMMMYESTNEPIDAIDDYCIIY